jgi:hypothetical protein
MLIKVDECCWNSVPNGLEGTNNLDFLTKIQNKNSRNLNAKHADDFLILQQKFVCLMPINRAMVMAIGRQHDVKYLMEIWRQIELLKMGEDSVLEPN